MHSFGSWDIRYLVQEEGPEGFAHNFVVWAAGSVWIFIAVLGFVVVPLHSRLDWFLILRGLFLIGMGINFITLSLLTRLPPLEARQPLTPKEMMRKISVFNIYFLPFVVLLVVLIQESKRIKAS